MDAAAVPDTLLCGQFTTPSGPPRPRRGVYELTPEARLELVGMFALRKAEDRHVDIVLTVRVAPPAEREPLCLAEDVDGQVLVAHATIGRECDLVRPVSVHHCFAEFTFTIDHRRPRKLVAARARRYLPRTGEGHAFTEPRAASALYSSARTKREQNQSPSTRRPPTARRSASTGSTGKLAIASSSRTSTQ
jgi:hypothetical protein